MSVIQTLTVEEETLDVVNNNSGVRIRWKSTQDGVSYNGDTRTAYYYVSINGGPETQYSVTYTLPAKNTVYIVSTFIRVNHLSDGTGSIKVRTWMDTDISEGVIELEKSLTLTTIPRATVLNSVGSFGSTFDSDPITITYTPQSANFYNKCQIYLNNSGTLTLIKTVDIGSMPASRQIKHISLSDDERAMIYNTLPSNAVKGILRFTLRTYYDSGYSTQIGDEVYKELKLSIPQNEQTLPLIGLEVAHSTTASDKFAEIFLQGKSKFKATITAEGQRGASIDKVECLFNMVKQTVNQVNSTSWVCDIFPSSTGELKLIARAYDSRTFYSTITERYTILPYSKPQIQDVSVDRCDKDGKITESGTYLKIKAKRSYNPVIVDGVQKNFCKIQYRYKSGASEYSAWRTILEGDANGDEVETDALPNEILLTTNTYSVQVQAIDDVGDSSTATRTIASEKVYLHKAGSKNSIGIGKYAEGSNTIDIDKDMTTVFRGEVRFDNESWTSLGLSANVLEPDAYHGKCPDGKGCYYRVCAGGKHIYIAFNCAFTYGGSAIQVNFDAIPLKYRPTRNVYSLCATDGPGIARVHLNSSGNIVMGWFQSFATSPSASAKWIDGYIDYWL